MDESTEFASCVEEHTRARPTADESNLRQVMREALLPKRCGVARAECKSETTNVTFLEADVLWREFNVQLPLSLGVEIRTLDVRKHHVCTEFTLPCCMSKKQLQRLEVESRRIE